MSRKIQLVNYSGDLLIPKKELLVRAQKHYGIGARLMIRGEGGSNGNKDRIKAALTFARNEALIISKQVKKAVLPNGEIIEF